MSAPTSRARRWLTVLLPCSVAILMGCGEAVHTLGTLSGSNSRRDPERNPCRSSSSEQCKDATPEGSVSAREDGSPHSPPGDARVDAASFTDASSTADACEERRTIVTRLGTNVFFLVDASPSIVLQPVWDRLVLALAGFVDDPAHVGLGVGVGYYGLSCDPAVYEEPAVPVAPLPGPAQAVRSTFPPPLSGKAIVPALRGTYTYVKTVRRADPLRDTVVILVSDGVLDPLCGSTDSSAAAEARGALAATPRIETRVVALGAGPSLLDPGDLANLAPLDAIAAAGGTGLAERVQINLLPDDAIGLALERAVVAAEPCSFRAPQPPSATARLDWLPSAGARSEWQRVANPASCEAAGGYFVRPSDPTRLDLCPESCLQLKGDAAGSATLVDGCSP